MAPKKPSWRGTWKEMQNYELLMSVTKPFGGGTCRKEKKKESTPTSKRHTDVKAEAETEAPSPSEEHRRGVPWALVHAEDWTYRWDPPTHGTNQWTSPGRVDEPKTKQPNFVLFTTKVVLRPSDPSLRPSDPQTLPPSNPQTLKPTSGIVV